MGIVVKCEGKTLWTPALTVGHLWVYQMEAVEKAFEMKSGVINELWNDSARIEPGEYRAFIEAIFTQLHRTSHPILFKLVEGCLPVCVALYYRIFLEWPNPDIGKTPETKRLLEESREIEGSMPR